MIDNFHLVIPFLKFDSEDDFYYLQLLQRKKENPQIGSNSRVVINYYIKSVEHLKSLEDEIKQICTICNARAMIRLNKRSFSKVAFKAITNVANSISNREYAFVKRSYDRACGDGHNDTHKKWIVDVDGVDCESGFLIELSSFINSLSPEGNKVLSVIPSKSGVHLITSPFNMKDFADKYFSIEVHKDNPTNLFIP